MLFQSLLTSLGCTFAGEPATEKQVRNLETRVGVFLPEDYRRFLMEVPPAFGDLCISVKEPTPFGDPCLHQFHSVQEVISLLHSNITPRNMVTIATGHFAKYMCLAVAGIDRGAVYALDGEFRVYFTDEQFRQRYPDMAPEIEKFLRMRAAEELPEKHDTYDNVYLVECSFEAFLRGLVACR